MRRKEADVRKMIVLALALALAVPPANAKSTVKRLGEDATGDGVVPGLDLAYLDVGRTGTDLEIRIGINDMFPVIHGYPEVPAIEWIFDVKGRTFIAEAVASTGRGRFFLFEVKDDTYQQLEAPTGTYDSANGYIAILVPLETIGATKKGTVISGTGEPGTEDVDVHWHYPGGTYYTDKLATERDFVVR